VREAMLIEVVVIVEFLPRLFRLLDRFNRIDGLSLEERLHLLILFPQILKASAVRKSGLQILHDLLLISSTLC
jgi:hypothetical protein